MGQFLSVIRLASLLSRADEDREFMAEPPVFFTDKISVRMRHHFCEAATVAVPFWMA